MRTRLILAAAAAAILTASAAPGTADTLVYPDQSVPDSGFVSPITAAFVAAVGPFNAYLEAVDRLAATRSAARARRVASREAEGRAAVIAELEAWVAGIRRERFAEARAPTIDRLGPIFGLVSDPIDILVVPADLRQRQDYVALERLTGRAFDEVFAVSRTATLRQIENTYIDYIKNGDDQTLRALSVHDLVRVRALLAISPRQ